jgi:hypothetical protein
VRAADVQEFGGFDRREFRMQRRNAHPITRSQLLDDCFEHSDELLWNVDGGAIDGYQSCRRTAARQRTLDQFEVSALDRAGSNLRGNRHAECLTHKCNKCNTLAA